MRHQHTSHEIIALHKNQKSYYFVSIEGRR